MNHVNASTTHHKLAIVIDELGEQERAILLKIAYRLRQGQHAFGLFALETDKRDWLEAATEEAFDESVYLAALLETIRIIRDSKSECQKGT